jgi:NADPH:quinone reductase-like Zn-dependent oxidoreductase
MVYGSVPEMIAANFQRRVVNAAADYSEAIIAEAHRELMEMAVAGHIRAVIDRTYPLARIAEAHAYVDTGRKRGSVVITVGSAVAQAIAAEAA